MHTNIYTHTHITLNTQFLNSAHLSALNNLSRNNDVVITRSDKGGGVVILNKEDYINKMLAILNDHKKFRVDANQVDSSKILLKDLKAILNKTTKEDGIDQNIIRNIVPQGYIIPRLYGLPKLHKRDIPCRPILSMVGSVVHKTAKFLAKVLKPVEEFFGQYKLNDSFDLVDKIKRHSNSGDNIVLGSLVIVSLFTSIPIYRCFDIINNAVTEQSVSITLSAKLLIRLLRICVCDIQFRFNNVYYKQIDGVAMGSPLGPVLANIFVGYIQGQVNPSPNHGILFYGRYVDDTIIIAQSRDSVNSLAESLNAVDPNIKFTIEYEQSDGTLPFLDVKIFNQGDGNLSFGWYHKDTWLGTFLHYASFVPVAWKKGLLKGFKYRILNICSPEKLDSAVNQLIPFFDNNGYPRQFIEENFINYIPGHKTKICQAPKKSVAISLPFIGDERSHILSRRIKKYVEITYPASRVVFYWKTERSVNYTLKDKINKFDIPGVIYNFTCRCKDDYVGRTEKCLKDRIQQHVPAWVVKGRTSRPRSDVPPDSAITRHLVMCANRPEDPRQCFDVLHRGENVFINRILEALEIIERAPRLCIQKDRLFTLKIPWR